MGGGEGGGGNSGLKQAPKYVWVLRNDRNIDSSDRDSKQDGKWLRYLIICLLKGSKQTNS